MRSSGLKNMNATTYPLAPGFKVLGTSAQAAAAVKEDVATLRERCYSMIELRGDMTSDECAARLNRSVLSVRPRFAELFAMQRIFKTGQRRQNTSGHSANVYSIDAQANLL